MCHCLEQAVPNPRHALLLRSSGTRLNSQDHASLFSVRRRAPCCRRRRGCKRGASRTIPAGSGRRDRSADCCGDRPPRRRAATQSPADAGRGSSGHRGIDACAVSPAGPSCPAALRISSQRARNRLASSLDQPSRSSKGDFSFGCLVAQVLQGKRGLPASVVDIGFVGFAGSRIGPRRMVGIVRVAAGDRIARACLCRCLPGGRFCDARTRLRRVPLAGFARRGLITVRARRLRALARRRTGGRRSAGLPMIVVGSSALALLFRRFRAVSRRRAGCLVARPIAGLAAAGLVGLRATLFGRRIGDGGARPGSLPCLPCPLPLLPSPCLLPPAACWPCDFPVPAPAAGVSSGFSSLGFWGVPAPAEPRGRFSFSGRGAGRRLDAAGLAWPRAAFPGSAGR